MKYMIMITLGLGVIRAVSDYGQTKDQWEKVGVMIVILMFITSLVMTFQL